MVSKLKFSLVRANHDAPPQLQFLHTNCTSKLGHSSSILCDQKMSTICKTHLFNNIFCCSNAFPNGTGLEVPLHIVGDGIWSYFVWYFGIQEKLQPCQSEPAPPLETSSFISPISMVQIYTLISNFEGDVSC